MIAVQWAKFPHGLYLNLSLGQWIKMLQTKLTSLKHQNIPVQAWAKKHFKAAVHRNLTRLPVCAFYSSYEASLLCRSQRHWINSACNLVKRITQPAECSVTTPSLSWRYQWQCPRPSKRVGQRKGAQHSGQKQ